MTGIHDQYGVAIRRCLGNNFRRYDAGCAWSIVYYDLHSKIFTQLLRNSAGSDIQTRPGEITDN